MRGINVTQNIEQALVKNIQAADKQAQMFNDDIYTDILDDPYSQKVQGKLVEQVVNHLQQKKVNLEKFNVTNKIIPLRQITQFEQSLLETFNRIYPTPSGQKAPKVAIITTQNTRSAQIAATLEQQFPNCSSSQNAMEKKFTLYKSQTAKKGNVLQQGKDQWRENLNQFDVFLFLPKIFHESLLHADFKMSDFDIVIFDEIHSCQLPDHAFNQLMTEFYFNNEKHREQLPLILGMASFDILFKKTDQIAQIQQMLMSFSNMLNSKLLTMSEQEAIEIFRISMAKFTLNNRQSLCKPFQMHNQVAELLQFLTNMSNNVVVGDKDWTLGTLFSPNQEIFALKQEDKRLVLKSDLTGAKLTIQDSKRLLTSVINLINNQLVLFKDKIGSQKITLKIESAQYVSSTTKIRYFSSRIVMDPLLALFLPSEWQNKAINYMYSENSIHFSLGKFDGAGTRVKDLLIFKKKLESENYLYLHLCSLLMKQSCQFLTENLLPDEERIKKFLNRHYGIPEPEVQSISSISIYSGQMISEVSKQTHASTTYHPESQSHSLSQSMVQSLSENEVISDFKNRISNMSEELEKKFKDEKNFNKGIYEYNQEKLKFIVKEMINPIILAIKYYEENAARVAKDKDKGGGDTVDDKMFGVRWMNLERNMNIDATEQQFSMDCQQQLKSPQPIIVQNINDPKMIPVIQENQYSERFRAYTETIFNVGGQDEILQDKKEFIEVAQMIDSWVEKISLPAYMTQHYDYSQLASRIKEDNLNENTIRNRTCLINMLVIALTDCETSNLEFRLIKDEMERLAFVGDSVINTAVIMNLYLKSQGGLNEKEFDKKKIAMIKSTNLALHADQFGLPSLLLKSKYYANGFVQDKNDLRPRKSNTVLQSLVGFLGIYVGFSSAYLLLYDVGLLKSQCQKTLGEGSEPEKIAVLQELSQQYYQVIQFERFAKSELYQQIIDKSQILNLEANEDKNESRFLDKQSFVQLFVKSSARQPKEFKFMNCTEPNSTYKSQLQKYQKHEIPLIQQKEQTSQVDNEKEEQSTRCDSDRSIDDSDNNSSGDSLKVPDSVIEHNDIDIQKIENFSRAYPTQLKSIELAAELFGIKQEDKKVEEQPRKEEEDDKIGYIHTHDSIMMQCFTHKSFSEKLAQQMHKIKLTPETIRLIIKQRQAVDSSIRPESVDESQFIRDFILQFNFQIFEYLGDSILNQTMAKHYYLETALCKNPKFQSCFGAQKLHDQKTWSTSNHWLASLFCEHFYHILTANEFKYPEQMQDKVVQTIQELNQKYNTQLRNEDYFEVFRKYFPLIPFLIDDTNTKYKDQLRNYQHLVFLQSFKSLNMETLYEKKEQQQEQQRQIIDEENFHDQQDCFVKIFSDSMEALFGGIFIDSGDFESTQLYILNLMKSHYFTETPRQDQERTKVLSVWNSKRYTHTIKVQHTVEEKDNNFYVRMYAGKLELRRCKFEKDKKRKVEKGYLDLRFYLENAYQSFEENWLKDKNKQQPTSEHWIAFNNDYRKNYRPNKNDQIKKRQKSLVKDACKQLIAQLSSQQQTNSSIQFEKEEEIESTHSENKSYSGSQSNLSNYHKLKHKFSINQPGLINEIRTQIIKAFTIAAQQTYKIDPAKIVLQIENERVGSSKIREMFNTSDIRQINTLSPKCNTVENWINQLTGTQAEQLFIEMERFVKQMNDSQYQESEDGSHSFQDNESLRSESTKASSIK